MVVVESKTEHWGMRCGSRIESHATSRKIGGRGTRGLGTLGTLGAVFPCLFLRCPHGPVTRQKPTTTNPADQKDSMPPPSYLDRKDWSWFRDCQVGQGMDSVMKLYTSSGTSAVIMLLIREVHEAISFIKKAQDTVSSFGPTLSNWNGEWFPLIRSFPLFYY